MVASCTEGMLQSHTNDLAQIAPRSGVSCAKLLAVPVYYAD